MPVNELAKSITLPLQQWLFFVRVHSLATTLWSIQQLTFHVHTAANLPPVGVQTRSWPRYRLNPASGSMRHFDGDIADAYVVFEANDFKERCPGGRVWDLFFFLSFLFHRGQDSCACNSNNRFLHPEAWGRTSGCSRRTQRRSLLQR